MEEVHKKGAGKLNLHILVDIRGVRIVDCLKSTDSLKSSLADLPLSRTSRNSRIERSGQQGASPSWWPRPYLRYRVHRQSFINTPLLRSIAMALAAHVNHCINQGGRARTYVTLVARARMY